MCLEDEPRSRACQVIASLSSFTLYAYVHGSICTHRNHLRQVHGEHGWSSYADPEHATPSLDAVPVPRASLVFFPLTPFHYPFLNEKDLQARCNQPISSKRKHSSSFLRMQNDRKFPEEGMGWRVGCRTAQTRATRPVSSRALRVPQTRTRTSKRVYYPQKVLDPPRKRFPSSALSVQDICSTRIFFGKSPRFIVPSPSPRMTRRAYGRHCST